MHSPTSWRTVQSIRKLWKPWSRTRGPEPSGSSGRVLPSRARPTWNRYQKQSCLLKIKSSPVLATPSYVHVYAVCIPVMKATSIASFMYFGRKAKVMQANPRMPWLMANVQRRPTPSRTKYMRMNTEVHCQCLLNHTRFVMFHTHLGCRRWSWASSWWQCRHWAWWRSGSARSSPHRRTPCQGRQRCISSYEVTLPFMWLMKPPLPSFRPLLYHSKMDDIALYSMQSVPELFRYSFNGRSRRQSPFEGRELGL